VKLNLLKIGTAKWTGYEPLYLAEKIGLFKKNNVKVKLLRNLSERKSIEKFQSGEIHAATVTLDMMFVLQESGFSIKAPLILDYSFGGDMIIGKKGINDLINLKGKKIGLEKKYVNEYFLVRALTEKKISINDISIVNIPEGGNAFALDNEKVDAVVAYNPEALTLLQKGYDILFSSKEIPSSIVDVIVFPKNIYEDNIDNIKNLILSWFKALRYINMHNRTAIRIMAESENVSEYEFNITFEDIIIPDLKDNLAFFDLESDKNIFKISDITQDFLIKKKIIKKKINSADIFDSSILAKINN
jgi:NitT/TauT family transport system substrate-binding protein